MLVQQPFSLFMLLNIFSGFTKVDRPIATVERFTINYGFTEPPQRCNLAETQEEKAAKFENSYVFLLSVVEMMLERGGGGIIDIVFISIISIILL